MPFDPTNFIFGKHAFPARHRFGADFRKVYARCGVAPQDVPDVRWSQPRLRIEVDLEIRANFSQGPARSPNQLFIRDAEPGTSSAANAPSFFCGAPPVRYDVVSGEPSRLSRFFQRDL